MIKSILWFLYYYKLNLYTKGDFMQPEMKYIYTVYQCGSFSKAAEKLFLTQPALSISVQKAEHEVGMPLFNRDKKPLELTEAGMI